MCLRTEVVHTADLPGNARDEIRRLLEVAFEGDFDDTDFDHALGGLHIVIRDGHDVRCDGTLVAHAAVVQRHFLLGQLPLRCGYVEAVAVRPSHGRRGIGGMLMERAEQIIDAAYELGALSASEQGRGLYLRHGWQSWEGDLGVLSPSGYRPTPDEQASESGSSSVLVWGADALDRSARLACDWRAGDVW